ncbi:hypothetical protein BDR03DRAFT_973827 [Suillus americanus]|nr:hypothetical protein BDR03DRAFT_973827 [Suillus americanus]
MQCTTNSFIPFFSSSNLPVRFQNSKSRLLNHFKNRGHSKEIDISVDRKLLASGAGDTARIWPGQWEPYRQT